MDDYYDGWWHQLQLEEERRMIDERGHVFVPAGPVTDLHRDGGVCDVGRIFSVDREETK